MFERILVPTDLSDFSLPALQCAKSFAGARITLLHANRFASSMYLEHPLGFYLDDSPAPKRALQQRLRAIAREHFEGVHDVETLVVDDEPAHAIAQAADDVGADLIIMATHGRGGSITRRVMERTSRPILAVGGTPPRPVTRATKRP
ncbi:MAG TPA: universal stress protein [Thermoanaerobaculia bacterium]|nr:universal stress protein [Thermoanaerobaculia bacterium]